MHVCTDNWSLFECTCQDSYLVIQEESIKYLGPSNVPRLVVSLETMPETTTGSQWEKGPMWVPMLLTLPFNRAAADKFISPGLTHRLTFQTWHWQENSRRREGWREAGRKGEMRKWIGGGGGGREATCWGQYVCNLAYKCSFKHLILKNWIQIYMIFIPP